MLCILAQIAVEDFCERIICIVMFEITCVDEKTDLLKSWLDVIVVIRTLLVVIITRDTCNGFIEARSTVVSSSNAVSVQICAIR